MPSNSHLLSALMLPLLLGACAITSHPSEPAKLGRASTEQRLRQVAAQPGPLRYEPVVGADWAVPLGGLLNLDHHTAREAQLEDHDEPVHVLMHVVRHPAHGTFLIDTGVQDAWRDPAAEPALGWMMQKAMNASALEPRTTMVQWLARQDAPPRGVLLTHLHLDHVMGLPDLPRSVPIYTGPGEAAYRGWQSLFLRSTLDALLEGFGALRELPFAEASEQAGLAGVLDVFGDESLFALWVPGHTPGHLAFLLRTEQGPVLLTGDACHTAWGWQHGVEPGSFSYDGPQGSRALVALRRLADDIEGLRVVPGHQFLPGDPVSVVASTD